MAYENYEQELIKSFGEEVKKDKISLENPDLSSSKARNKYTQYLTSITRFKPQEYLISSFPILGINKVIEISNAIIYVIFGEQVLPHLEEFYKVLHQSETTSALDGISLSALNQKTNEVISVVEVPNLNYSSTITAIVHEFTHFLLKKVNIDFAKKSYYEEILSIYAEKVANIYIYKELGPQGSEFLRKIAECRIEGINWHYNSNLPAVEETLGEYNKLIKQNRKDFLTLQLLANVEKTFPLIRTAQGQSIIKGYYKNLADSYGIGYLFAETLFQKHLDDYQTLGLQIGSVLKHEQSFQDLLNYYAINTRNYEVYDNVNAKLAELRKIR